MNCRGLKVSEKQPPSYFQSKEKNIKCQILREKTENMITI